MVEHKISTLNIAFLYVGTLMGAGFASGKEVWQFFSVFGEKSYFAILLVTLLFVIFGIMTVKISAATDSADIGKIIMPFENAFLENIFGHIVAVILFIVYIIMAAAGGALLHEQFGIPNPIGGALLMMLVIATSLGGFERISKNFKYIIPVLLIIVFTICFMLLILDLPSPGIEAHRQISPMAPKWYIAVFVYISYNMLAGVPILSNSTKRSKNKRVALRGAILGGIILGFAAFVMNAAMLTDEGLSSTSVLPILSLAGKLSPFFRWVYAILLLFAIYSSATSNFYGFTTKIKNSSNKMYYIIFAAFAGYLMSLFGFAEIITFVLPIEGYFGMLFLVMMSLHFVGIIKSEKFA